MKRSSGHTTGLWHAITRLGFGLSVKGRLYRAIRLCRPNWTQEACHRAVRALSREGVKQGHQFSARNDYLRYLEQQLTRYTASHGVFDRIPVADDLELKRWERRWQASRQHLSHTAHAGQVDAWEGRSAA